MPQVDTTHNAQRPMLFQRKALWAALVVLVAGLAFVLVWFQPQKLFIDDTVNEASPLASAGTDQANTDQAKPATLADTAPSSANTVDPTPSASPAPNVAPAATAAAPAPATGPVVVARGSFQSIEHETVGTALLIAQPDGSHVLRFEDLDTSNGPDLRVLLSPSAAAEAYEEGSLELGGLKGNQGSQNYPIPIGTDPGALRTAVIWCERFSVAFGVAELRPL